MEEKKLRKVMVGTPSASGRVEVSYLHSLLATISLAPKFDTVICPYHECYDALEKVRNNIFMVAHESDIDDLVFIDDDMDWKAEDFFKLLNHPVNVVGGTARIKTDEQEIYPIRKLNDDKKLEYKDGMIKVEAVGTGFLRISKKAIEMIWDKLPEYVDRGVKRRNAFGITFDEITHELLGEDISFCRKFTALTEESIYLDPTITCGHYGTKGFYGDCLRWLYLNNHIQI